VNVLFVVVGVLVMAALAVAGLVIAGPLITHLSHTGRITHRTAALLRAVRWTMVPVLGFVFLGDDLFPTPLAVAVIVGTFALSAMLNLRKPAEIGRRRL
jgi:hypothetical protein